MRYPTIVVRPEILTSWLTVSDYSRSRLASELGISKGRITQLISSHEEPSAHLIAKLMSVTNLPFDRLFRMVRTMPAHSIIRPRTTARLGRRRTAGGKSTRRFVAVGAGR